MTKMVITQNYTDYSIQYAYPSSITATSCGFGKSGCYFIQDEQGKVLMAKESLESLKESIFYSDQFGIAEFFVRVSNYKV